MLVALQVMALSPSAVDAIVSNGTEDDIPPEATIKAAKSVGVLTAVYTQANATLTAIRQTAAALDAVEKAAAAVERAKGRHDDTVSVRQYLGCTGTFGPFLHFSDG